MNLGLLLSSIDNNVVHDIDVSLDILSLVQGLLGYKIKCNVFIGQKLKPLGFSREYI